MQTAALLTKSATERNSSHFTTGHRLLIATTPAERDLFLPHFSDFDESGAGVIEWCNTEGLTVSEWHQILDVFDPTILVSCWSTRGLPAEDEKLRSLRYVCHLTGSIRHVVPKGLLSRGVLVTNWGPLVSSAVAEHALLLALAALRNLPNWPGVMVAPEDQLREARWKLKTRTLHGRQVGIHGFGNIARALLTLLKPFQVKISVYSEGVPRSYIEQHQVAVCDSLEDLFQMSEVLFECEALTERSKGSVSESVLGLMMKDAVFVNVGRGAVVAEDALAKLGITGHLRLGLDVFEAEVPPEDSLLWQVPAATMSPHIAGPTQDQYRACGELALANIRRFVSGESVEFSVGPEIYDYSS